MEKKLIDDAFYVDEKKYGLWYSTDKDGNGLITLSLKSNVSRRPVTILKDGRKVSLRPELMRVKSEVSCE